MARAFRPRVFHKYQLGEPRVEIGGLHNWWPIKSGVLTDKTIQQCTQCGCLSTSPTKVCGDPVPGHLHIYHGEEPPLWIGEELKWRRARKDEKRRR